MKSWKKEKQIKIVIFAVFLRVFGPGFICELLSEKGQTDRKCLWIGPYSQYKHDYQTKGAIFHSRKLTTAWAYVSHLSVFFVQASGTRNTATLAARNVFFGARIIGAGLSFLTTDLNHALEFADNTFNQLTEWLSEKFSTTSKFFVSKLPTPSDRARQAESKSFLHLPSKVPLEFFANSQSLKMGVFVSNYYRIGALPRPCTEPLNSSK